MAECFNEQSIAFLDWLQSRGVTISDKFELIDLRGERAGRGVVAVQDIVKDETLFSVPRASILTTQTSDLPTTLTESLDSWLALILVMAYEYRKGSDSPWQPYFAVLPEEFNTLMFWSDSELSHLKGSSVRSKIGRRQADETFKKQVIPIVQQNLDIFNITGLSNEDLLALCHRMGSTIMAYAFDLEKPSTDRNEEQQDGWEEVLEPDEQQPKGMIPLADILNANADLNNARLFHEDDAVVMKSIKSIQAGEEILNDYGPLPRSDLLRRYGYVTDRYAEHDVVDISQALIVETVKQEKKLKEQDLKERLVYLDEQSVLDDAYDISRVENEDGPFPEELCLLLNLLVLDKEVFQNIQKREKLPKPDLSQDALKLVSRVLVRRRAEYGVSRVDSDRDVLESMLSSDGDPKIDNSMRRRIMAVQVIIGEKEVLQEVHDFVQEQLGSKTDGKRRANTFEDDAIAEDKKQKMG